MAVVVDDSAGMAVVVDDSAVAVVVDDSAVAGVTVLSTASLELEQPPGSEIAPRLRSSRNRVFICASRGETTEVVVVR